MKNLISLTILAGLICAPVFANAQNRNVYPSAAAPRQDANQDMRRLVQDLTSQQAVSLIYASNLANARETQLISANNQKDRQIRTLIAENRRVLRENANNAQAASQAQTQLNDALKQLDEIVAERDNLTSQIVARSNEAKQQIDAYEAAIRKIALSDDPNIIAYLERFAAGDNSAVDEFVSYARAQHEIRQRMNNIEFAEQLRVGAAQKNSQRIKGQATLNDVIPLYREAYENDPNDFRGAVYLARLYDEKGDKQRALAIYRALIPTTQEPIYKMVLFNDIGDIQSEYDKPAALVAYQTALNEARQYLAQDPQDIERKSWLVTSLTHVADELASTEKPQAIPLFEEALGSARSLVTATPDDDENKQNLTMVLDRFSEAVSSTDLPRAVALREEALNIETALLEKNQGNIKYQNNIVVLYQSLGDLYSQTNLKKTTEYYLKAIDAADALVDIDPERAESQRLLARSFTALSRILSAFDDSETAYLGYQQALSAQRTLARQEPNNIVLKREITQTLISIIKLGEDTNPSEVKAFAQEAYDLSNADFIANPNDFQAKYLFASTNLRLGIVLANLDDAAALPKLEFALTSLLEIRNSFTQKLAIDFDIAKAQWRLARYLLKQGNGERTNQLYHQAIDTYQALNTTNPDDFTILVPFGDVYKDLAKAFQNSDDKELAKTFATEALAEYRQALETLPKSKTINYRVLNALHFIAQLTDKIEDWQATKDFADIMKSKNMFEAGLEPEYQEMVAHIARLNAATNAAPNGVQH